MIAEKYRADFSYTMNQHLRKGYRAVPGTIYAIPLSRKREHFFSITLWLDGNEITVTADSFETFVKSTLQYFKMGYSVVVGTLYAAEMRRHEATSDQPSDYDCFFFNIINKD